MSERGGAEARPIRVVRPTDSVRTTAGAGDSYRYLATGSDTDGGYFLVEATVPPGGGPPLHVQTREEEAFYILQGELTFYGDAGEIHAVAGTFLNVPKGARHRFRNNGTTTARMLFFFTPAGIEGLFGQLAALNVSAGGTEALLGALNAAGRPYGVEYLATPAGAPESESR
jgi:quercetin dioxygenase-like cupin family protein